MRGQSETGTAVSRRSVKRLAGKGELESMERAFLNIAGGEYALALSSGTAALHVSLLAADIGPGDEIIVCTYGWGGTVGAVLATGATPVFADVDPASLTMCHRSVEKKIGLKTKGILTTHFSGQTSDMGSLSVLAEKYGLSLIADGAQALGATIQSEPIGDFGVMTAFSLGDTKALPAAEGGMLIFNDYSLFQRAVIVSQHPLRAFREVLDPSIRCGVDEIGLNYRMHPAAAALGLEALRDIPDRLTEWMQVNEMLAHRLEDIPGMITHQSSYGCDGRVYHGLPLTYCPEETGMLPVDLYIEALQAEGVPVHSGPVKKPIHLRRRFHSIDREFWTPKSWVPWDSHPSWEAGACPVAEHRCPDREVILYIPDKFPTTSAQWASAVVEAFEKVAESIDDLLIWQKEARGVTE